MGRPSLSVPRLALSFMDETDRPLPSEADLVFFLAGDKALPDHRSSPGISLAIGFNDRFTNRDYWRELFDYGVIHARKIQVRPALLNEGTSALTDVKLEVSCMAETGDSVQLILGSQLPEVPRSSGLPFPAGSHFVGRNAEVSVRRGIHVAALSFGKILPGEQRMPPEDVVLLPNQPGLTTIVVRVFASELSAPVTHEFALSVAGESRVLDIDGLLEVDENLGGTNDEDLSD